ncbi:B-cell receptor CD22-like [Amia ocellicauda]|uniref:B-cell receptor CD22-like n=1 Tax=Amia ocellicauda TaxID=2972642 RepID=UPI003464A9AB
MSPSGANGTVREGDAVTLTCDTGSCSSTQTQITWIKNGRPISHTQTPNNTLHLNPVSYRDSGNYSCAVREYSETRSQGFTVDVHYAPKSTSVSVSPSGEIVEGSPVTLTCSSNANPPVQRYSWFQSSGAAVWEKGSGQSLNISNFSSGDSGQYYCEAQNKHGAHNSTAVPLTITAPAEWETVLAAVLGSALCVCIVTAVILICVRRRKAGPSAEESNRDTGTPVKEATGAIYSIVGPSDTPQRGQDPSAPAQGWDDLNYTTVFFQSKTTARQVSSSLCRHQGPSVCSSAGSALEESQLVEEEDTDASVTVN